MSSSIPGSAPAAYSTPVIARRAFAVVATGLVLAGSGCTRAPQGAADAAHAGPVVRIVTPELEPPRLARGRHTVAEETTRAESLLADLGYVPEVRLVPDRARLLELVATGQADLAVARLSVTPRRAAQVRFTVALDRVREQVVVGPERDAPRTLDELAGMRLAVRLGSSYAETADALAERVPGLRVDLLPGTRSTESILEDVADGVLEATIADDAIVEAVRAWRPELRPGLVLGEPRAIAWAVRPDAEELARRLDAALTRSELVDDLLAPEARDLSAIRARGVLRVLTRNNAVTYFLHRGHPMGFEYELARRFARSIGCRVRVVVPPRAEDLVPWLLEGRGDLIAASFSVTEERARTLRFGPPYLEVHEMLVVRADERPRYVDIGDLAGRTVAVRRSSAYRDTLERLATGARIVDAPEDLETADLIDAVAAGRWDATLADSHILALELSWRDDVAAAFPVGPPRKIAWAMRPSDGELAAAVDRFFARERGGREYNWIHRKYFGSPARRARTVRREREGRAQLTPWDDLFRRAGERWRIDWRLLAAQAWVESRFDPDRRSFAGARGVMQVMPRTARELGVTGDLHDPAVGIDAGARYLRWLIDSFETTLPVDARIRFALASYNVGRGHVLDARRLARRLDRDPDRWFGGVETVAPLLARREYAARAAHGYCRCRSAVRYVREISDRYLGYLAADGAARPSSQSSTAPSERTRRSAGTEASSRPRGSNAATTSPASRAARQPGGESSTASTRVGGTPRARLARR